MRGLRLNLVRTLLSPAIATVLAFAPVLAQAQDGLGLTGADRYESPTYGYEVTWSDDWAAVPGSTTSENDRDTLTLDNGSAIRVQVIGVDPETDLEDLLASMVDPIAEAFPDADVSELDSVEDEVATAIEFTIGDQPAIQRMEARLLPSGDAAIGVRISTNPDLYASAVAKAAETILIDGDPAFTNLSGVASDEDDDETGQDDGVPQHRDPGSGPSDDENQGTAGGATFDLAAIPFLPAENDNETWELYDGSDTSSVGEAAQLTADSRGITDDDEVESIEENYAEWGWQRNYLVTYVQAESLGDDGYSDVIQVILDSYDDPAGAQAAFAFESDVEAITAFDAEIETDVETYGVESYAISLIGESDTGQEFGGVAISFRINAVNATVAILDYDGDVPKIADVEPLAESLEVRIEAAVTEGTETLGLAAVTVEGDDVSAASGYYLRIDGQTAPIAGETADALEVRDDGYGDAEAIYGTFHRIAAGEDGFEDDGSINMWLYRFATDQSAGEWFDDLAESLQLEENVAPDLGDESLGYATVIDLGAADDATGFVVYVLTGQYVVLIDANAVGGVELATVEDLLEEQLACLNAGVCDDPVPVPDELSGGDALD